MAQHQALFVESGGEGWHGAGCDAAHVDKVAAASPDIEYKEAPEGYVKIHKNHHLWSKTRIGQSMPDGQFKLIAESPKLIEPDPFPKGYQ